MAHMNIDAYQGLAVKDLAQALKLLAEPNRLRMVCGLGLECRPVTDIIEMTGLEQTNVSFHLRVLREAGLVRAERRGPFIYYCIPDPELLEILGTLSAWLKARPLGTNGDAASEMSAAKPGKKGWRASSSPKTRKAGARTPKSPS